MARDVIISAFAGSQVGQPMQLFEDEPVRVDVNGIGSDVYKASFDTERKPREPWGGKPFSREAERYRNKGAGSVLQGLLRSHARGVEPRRIALVGFSAGNTFLSAVLKNPHDAPLVDTLISLDGMVYSKDWKGNPVGFDHWVAFARRATGTDRMATAANPYKGPLMVVSHTDIVSGAPKRASSTRDAARHLMWRVNDAYWAAAKTVPRSVLDEQGAKQQQVVGRLRQASERIPLPLKIRGGNPPTTKTWSVPPWPEVGYLGNLWNLSWGGRGGPDHIFQANQCQRMLWEAYLVPRWNARSVAVAGLGGGGAGRGAIGLAGIDWVTPEHTRPGGGIVAPGTLDTGLPTWIMAAGVGLVCFWGGATIVERT